MVGVGRGVRDKRGVRVVTVDGIGGWGLGLGKEVGLGLGEGVGLGSEIKRRGGEVFRASGSERGQCVILDAA